MRSKRNIKADADYLDLVKKYPLRVIHTEQELDAATTVAMKLAIKGEAKLTKGETDYLDVLDMLIEDYEEMHHAMPVGKLSLVERLG